MSASVHYLPRREKQEEDRPTWQYQGIKVEYPPHSVQKAKHPVEGLPNFHTMWNFTGVPLFALPLTLLALGVWHWAPVVFPYIRSLF
jgi:hypothetical protein